MTRIFFDTEFTGLHQKTTLISLGCVADDETLFYGEFTDYDHTQIDDWLRNNVIDRLWGNSACELSLSDYMYVGDTSFIRGAFLTWLEQFERVELWSDCLAYDWVLLSELIANRDTGYPIFPSNLVYHSPFDILTLFEIGGVPLDTNRADFAGIHSMEHNALQDACVIKACYDKLMRFIHAQ